MVETEKGPQGAGGKERPPGEAAAEGGEESQGPPRRAAEEGEGGEGRGTVQPGRGPPIGEAHAGKDLPFGAEATGNRQADERRDERNEKT